MRLRFTLLYIIAAMFSMLNVFLQVLPINSTSHFSDSLGLSVSQTVRFTSLYFILYAAMQIPSGVLLDRFGIKYVLSFGLFFNLIGMVLYMYSPGKFSLAFSRGLSGFGCSVSYISGVYIAVNYLSKRWLPLLIATIEAISILGAVFAVKFFNQLLISFGWVISNMILIVFALTLFFLAILLTGGISSNNAPIDINFSKLFKALAKILINPEIITICIYCFSTWLVIMSFAGYWLKNYLVHMHAYSEARSLNVVEVYWLGFILSGLTVGFFLKTLAKCRKALLILAIINFLNFMLFSIPLLFDYWLILVVAFIAGMCSSGVIVAFTIVSKIIPDYLCGSAMSLVNTFVAVSGYFGQVIFAFMLEHFSVNKFIHVSDKIANDYYGALLIYPFFTFVAVGAAIYIFTSAPKDIV